MHCSTAFPVSPCAASSQAVRPQTRHDDPASLRERHDMNEVAFPRRGKARMSSLERRQLILETTLHMLIRDGAEATTLRGICREMAVAPSLMRHFFISWHDLLGAVFDMSTDRFMARLKHIMAAEVSSERARMMELIRHYLALEWTGDGSVSAFMALWQLTRKNHALKPSFSRFIDDRYRLIRQAVARLAREAQSDIDTDEAAAALLLLLDGAWLHLSVNPGHLPQRTAETLCWSWLAERLRKPEWQLPLGGAVWQPRN